MNRPHRRTAATSPLTKTDLQVSITDLVAEYELRHVFTNEGDVAIEAVYSFPVPLDSAFMGMRATLAGETLEAQVMPARRASRQYDDAIVDGNSAVLLERLEPGMLCVNLGNMKPGEQGEIVLRFAALLQSADGMARFSLPLVHRPRYGRSHLDEITAPSHDFAIEHPLEATIRVNGLLAGMPVHCTTHGVRFAMENGSMVLRLGHAMLDRDLVLGFELPEDLASQGRLVHDGDQSIGVLSFSTLPKSGAKMPTDFCLVLDGSGSMCGDAILQSRQALQAVSAALGDDDRIQVLRFGSTIVPLFRRTLKSTGRVRAALQSLAATVDADLGGTEMGKALDTAINALSDLDGQGRSQAIILVTDGAVQPYEIADAQTKASTAGIRIFVVAVGSSAGADVLAPLAKSTRAVMERAVPAEPIDACVMRQFRRARESNPVNIEIDWGTQDARPLPLGVVYPGDAVTAIAFLPSQREFEARVHVPELDDSLIFVLDMIETAPALRAIAGYHAHYHASAKAKEDLALRYGLITEETSAVLVKIRAAGEKVEGLPNVIPVAHMVPEGMVCELSASLSDSMGGLACFSVDFDRPLRSAKSSAALPFPVAKAPISRPVGKVAVAVVSARPAVPVSRGKVKTVPYKTDETTGRPIIPNGYKPGADEEYMSTLQLEYFRQRLLDWRADLVEESKQTIESLKDEVRGVGDEAERATRETENSLELRTRDRYRKLIGKIDSTLKRLEAGDYGYCADSGEEIGLERLEARLTAERTIDAQERWEHLVKTHDGEPTPPVSQRAVSRTKTEPSIVILDALGRALAELLLSGAEVLFSRDILLEYIDPDLREEVRAYLDAQAMPVVSAGEATELMLILLDQLTAIALTDDQEARLAVIRGIPDEIGFSK